MTTRRSSSKVAARASWPGRPLSSRWPRFQPVVRHARFLVDTSYRVLGRRVTEAVLRATFFGHFCGGTDLSSVTPTVHRLEQRGIGSILDYAAEKDVADQAGSREQAGNGRSGSYFRQNFCLRGRRELRGQQGDFQAVRRPRGGQQSQRLCRHQSDGAGPSRAAAGASPTCWPTPSAFFSWPAPAPRRPRRPTRCPPEDDWAPIGARW